MAFARLRASDSIAHLWASDYIFDAKLRTFPEIHKKKEEKFIFFSLFRMILNIFNEGKISCVL